MYPSLQATLHLQKRKRRNGRSCFRTNKKLVPGRAQQRKNAPDTTGANEARKPATETKKVQKIRVRVRVRALELCFWLASSVL
jgi:hypothetical protein